MWDVTVYRTYNRLPLQYKKIARPRTNEEVERALSVLVSPYSPQLMGIDFEFHADIHHLGSYFDRDLRVNRTYSSRSTHELPSGFNFADEITNSAVNAASIVGAAAYGGPNVVATCQLSNLRGYGVFIDFNLVCNPKNLFPPALWKLFFLSPNIHKVGCGLINDSQAYRTTFRGNHESDGSTPYGSRRPGIHRSTRLASS